MTTTTRKFNLGQQVWLTGRHRGDTLTTVSKVGRLYFEVSVTQTSFDLTTGFEKGDRHGNGYRIVTLTEKAEADRKHAAYKALDSVKITVHWEARQALPVDTIEVLALVAKLGAGEALDLPANIAGAVATLRGYVTAQAEEPR